MCKHTHRHTHAHIPARVQFACCLCLSALIICRYLFKKKELNEHRKNTPFYHHQHFHTHYINIRCVILRVYVTYKNGIYVSAPSTLFLHIQSIHPTHPSIYPSISITYIYRHKNVYHKDGKKTHKCKNNLYIRVHI